MRKYLVGHDEQYFMQQKLSYRIIIKRFTDPYYKAFRG